MYKLVTVPLRISEVFKNGWSLFKSSFVYVLAWSLILAIIHVIPYLFNFVGLYRRDFTGHLVYSWGGLLLFFILLIPESFFTAVFFYVIYFLGTEQKVDYPKVFDMARHQLVKLYSAMIVYFIFINLAILLFVLPVIYVGVLFSMVVPLILFGKLNIVQSFEGSAGLVWGNWWQTFFVLFIPYGIAFLARSLSKFTIWNHDWLLLADVIVLTAVIPYYYSVLIVQYNNLKVIKSLPAPVTQSQRTHAR